MVSPQPLLVATRSAGKVRELGPMIAGAGFQPISLKEAGIEELDAEEGIEKFETFEENALAKARYFHGRAGGLAVLADDSEARRGCARRGAPGVRSKRWSGSTLTGAALDEANNATLLRALLGTATRTGRYVCVAAIVSGPREWTARGECAGTILTSPRGNGGFGYDPLFLSSELGVTFGEATLAQKEHVSHRGRAVRAALAAFGRDELDL